MNHNNRLLSILQGCLNSNSVQASERQLVEYSNGPNFVPELLQLIPNQSNDIIVMILSTVKNFCQENYNNPHPNSLTQDQKQILRDNLFNLFYIINHIPQALNLYKQIVYIVISVDFEKYSSLFYGLIKQDLESGPISASIYFSRQVARCYEWLNMKEREPLDYFINNLFPKFEELVMKIMTDYNQQTKKLLEELLQMFYSAFHIEVPQYLRDFSNLDKWLLYFRTILKAPLDDFPNNHIEVTRIYVKIFSMYCRDGTDGKNYKGWGLEFRRKYALDLYTQVVQILVNPFPSQQIMSNILSCLVSVVSNPDLKSLIQEDHCQAIIYKHLLPFMESTNEDDSYFKNDGLQYIRRSEDLTCHPYRRVSLDLIKVIAEKFSFGGKSQLMKLVEHSANVLGGNYPDKQKQVILIVLDQLAPLIAKNQYLQQNFEHLTQQYFIPLIKSNNEILVAQMLKTLTIFLKKLSLSTGTVTELMGILYDLMCGNCLVIKFYSVLAFTELLYDKQALESAKPHFQNILQIYVKLLQTMDHQDLILSLQSMVKSFSNQIVLVSSNLADHLFNMFYSLHNKQSGQNNDDDEENETKQAAAALSTIKQILNSPLTGQQYYQISEKVMILLQGLCSDYDDYFEEVLSLVNTLVYKSGNIVNYQFPYLLCRKLLEGDNSILGNCQNRDFVQIISEAEKADTQYSQSLISILKNLIQKMPSDILHRYPYSHNPQIILCMIENKKLDQGQLAALNTSEVDTQWGLIIQSYAFVVYGMGSICDTRDLKMQSGISLYPWIQHKLDIEVIKRFMLLAEDEEAGDDYYEEDTVHMLQQFANQDDEEDDDFYVSSGGNYTHMYESPYDCTKDELHLVSKLKLMTPQQCNYIFSQLKPKYAAKLQEILNR